MASKTQGPSRPRKPKRPKGATRDARQRMWLTVFEASGSTDVACEEIGIKRQTYYDWRRDKVFVKQVEDAEQRFLDQLEDVVRRGSKLDARIAQQTLAARRPERWSQKHRLEGSMTWRRDIKVTLLPSPQNKPQGLPTEGTDEDEAAATGGGG